MQIYSFRDKKLNLCFYIFTHFGGLVQYSKFPMSCSKLMGTIIKELIIELF